MQNSNRKEDIKGTVSIVLPVEFEGEFMYLILKANVGVFCCLRHDMDMHSQRGCLFSYAQKDGPGGSWSRAGIFCVGTPPPFQFYGGAWARADFVICLFLHEQGSFCKGTGLFVCVVECFCIVELVFQILCYIRLLR